MKNNIIKIVILCTIAYFLCDVQAYISMYEYKDIQLPAFIGSYWVGVAGISLAAIICPLLVPLYFPLFHLLFKRLNAKYKSILLSVMFMLYCFFINYYIFTERVAAWSTFTIAEEFYNTLLHSYITIPIATMAFYFLSRKLLIFNFSARIDL